MFHLVSLSLQISLTFAWLSAWPVCVGCCGCLFGWVGFWFLSLGKFVFNLKLTPVVDRPSLALVRQCRKKNAALQNVSACRGNFSGASASHSTASAAQQHGVTTAPPPADGLLTQLL